ncbi:hypothetical protein DERF_007630 [Dermatophagoides farinae]|uniref:Uncharacterized protein n=1 Tax=Dermatophagoides farinae TaxID=6954 RepID=A0A922I1H7_DERFA|nr:hypothetical protein DERF_007630 [Dermatophagoides farinae]
MLNRPSLAYEDSINIYKPVKKRLEHYELHHCRPCAFYLIVTQVMSTTENFLTKNRNSFIQNLRDICMLPNLASIH